MSESALYTRFAERRLTESLEDSPITLIHGPRQCGKTTLALMVCAPDQLNAEDPPRAVRPAGSPGYTYLTFDDAVTRAGAETDPVGFVADLPERIILDEVQRVPGLFAAMKLEVDQPSGGGPIPPDGFEQRAPRPCAVGLAGGAHGDGAAASVGAVRTPRVRRHRAGFLDVLFGGAVFEDATDGQAGTRTSAERIVIGGISRRSDAAPRPSASQLVSQLP